MPGSSRLEEFLEKFLEKNIALSDAEDTTPRLLNRGSIACLPLLRTLLGIHQKSQEPSFWKVIGAFVLLAYANLTASRTLLQWLILSELNFRFRRFILLVKTKKWFLWIMPAAQAAENQVDQRSLTWYLQWGLDTWILDWTLSQISLTAQALSVSSHETSLICPNQHKNSHKLCNEMGISFLVHRKSMETEITIWSEFPNRGKVTLQQILASVGIN